MAARVGGDHFVAPGRARAIICPALTALTITADDAGQRVDRFLRKILPAASLSHIFAALRRGEVRLGGARVEGSYRLQCGDVLAIGGGLAAVPRRDVAADPAPSSLPSNLVVVLRDEDLLVVDKPAGLAMHPGTGVHDHLLDRVHRLLGASRGHSFRVAPAHRLDRDTSGLVVFGVSARGLRGFTAALRDHAVRKTYLARVHGSPPPRGEIDLSLARHDASVGPKMHVDPGGATALTRYRVVSTAAQRALLEVELATGRTHQIRAHFAAIGHPLVGDHRYGRADGARRLCLHAWRLEFAHPISRDALCLVATPPPELRA